MLTDMEELKELSEQLKKENLRYFNDQTIDNFITCLDTTPRTKSYNYFLDENEAIWSSIEQSGGENALADFNKCLLLRLIDRFPARKSKSHEEYPPSIISEFHSNFQRILDDMRLLDNKHYRPSNDLFLKDLGICRLRLIPVGPRVIEPHSGYSRKILISGGLKQFLRFLYFYLFVERASTPFYQTHVHLSLVKNFNPDAIHESYLRIAELLKLNPEAKGLLGASWYYDPALETISPHLTYLRSQQEDSGAWLFYSEPETANNPFVRSRTRKTLYETGKYKPKIYVCIWPSKYLIAYAENKKR